ncbi:D-2-hydroxyacid dehydrogenase [Liquorilactobacillus capillatus]|uniref:D-lactate dehydrogenase n=1 Tax=Liquorilactobacillus capillatus DSM 19910 TaxID=1423731 RepID=A0A0R1M1C9_9LACO|nr:D-2-hydroxyacid dehydrogenase [Liquorilactobacillus capillatus]KRL01807.1 D-lactate dehydrogenase [Liquorilactobacillus capillatus DSM 19910]
MKILMTSVRDDEQKAITEWAHRNKVQVDMVSWDLHEGTAVKVQGYDGLVTQQRSKVEASVYPILKKAGLKQITTRTAGYDMIDLAAAKENGMQVTNVPAYSPRSVAELALTHTMRLIRNLELFDKRMAKQDYRWDGLQAKEIHSLTVGIIGAGRIGGTTAQLFKALGAEVLAYDLKEQSDLKEIVTYTSKKAVLTKSDVICLHVDLNETSYNLIDKQALELMKPTAFIVNECRGPVIDTDALITALEQKKIAGAALDTLTGEENFFNVDLQGQELPSEQLQKLREMDNVIITPHIGFYTNIAVKNMVDISLDDVLLILKGKHSPHQVA